MEESNTSQSSIERMQNQQNGNNSRTQISSSSQITLDCNSISELDMYESEPTSALLEYCNRKFLAPYVNLMGLAGLRPASTDTTNLMQYFSHFQTILTALLLGFSYGFQNINNYRRDRGYTINYPAEDNNNPEQYGYYLLPYRRIYEIGKFTLTYIMPNLLHLSGFIMAVYIYRFYSYEDIQNLVGRVFIITRNPKRLMRSLWIHVIVGLAWLFFGFSYILVATLDLDQSNLEFTPSLTVKIIMVLTVVYQDFIQMIITLNYCIQCSLLRSYIYNLRDKLCEHTIEPIEWMKEMCEFLKLLDHLNSKVTHPVCILIIMNIAYTLSSVIYLIFFFDFHTNSVNLFSIQIMNFFVWFIVSIVPFFEAATLTTACNTIRMCGHQIVIRPFVYFRTSAEELYAVLNFASSLRMDARLFNIAIHNNYICVIIVIICISILTVGLTINIDF